MLVPKHCLYCSNSLIARGSRQIRREETLTHVVLQLLFVAPLPPQVRLNDDIESMVLGVESNGSSAERLFHIDKKLAEPTLVVATSPEQPNRVASTREHQAECVRMPNELAGGCLRAGFRALLRSCALGVRSVLAPCRDEQRNDIGRVLDDATRPTHLDAPIGQDVAKINDAALGKVLLRHGTLV